METVLHPDHFTDLVNRILVGMKQFGSLIVTQLKQILIGRHTRILAEKTGKCVRGHADPRGQRFEIDLAVQIRAQIFAGGFHATVLFRFQKSLRRQQGKRPCTQGDRQQGIVQTVRLAAFQGLAQFIQHGTHFIVQIDHVEGETRIAHAHGQFEMDIELERHAGAPGPPVAVRRQDVELARLDVEPFAVGAQAGTGPVVMVQPPERPGEQTPVPESSEFHISGIIQRNARRFRPDLGCFIHNISCFFHISAVEFFHKIIYLSVNANPETR